MFKGICCGKIKLLIGISMMIMIVSKNSVRAYGRKDSHGRKEQNIKHFLTHIKNKDLLDKMAVSSETKTLKCTEIINNGYPLSAELAALTNVPTVAECMANCDKNKACLAWIAYPGSGQCWLRSSTGPTSPSTGFQGGSCIEATKKVKCTEVTNYGYYRGSENSAVPVTTSPRCTKLCDESNTCKAWAYNVALRQCTLVSKVTQWVDDPNYKSGSCDAIISSKCKEKLSGTTYTGVSKQLEMINTIDDCIKTCENDNVCSAWSHNTPTKICYLYTSVSDVSSNSAFTSGQCYRGDLMAPVCEKKQGYPKGGSNTKMPQILTEQDCKTKCDVSMQCWGWTFQTGTANCWHYSTAYGFTANNAYAGGSCYVSNPPYIDILPITKFQQQLLDKHNEYRKKHCAQQLTLSDDLSEMAQDYAERLANLGKTPPNFSGIRMDNVYSQKLDYKLDGSVPVNEWYREIDQHNWLYPDFTKRNRFARVIWKGARQLGVGRAFSRDETTMYVVASYYPGGYIEESYKDNVKQQC